MSGEKKEQTILQKVLGYWPWIAAIFVIGFFLVIGTEGGKFVFNAFLDGVAVIINFFVGLGNVTNQGLYRGTNVVNNLDHNGGMFGAALFSALFVPAIIIAVLYSLKKEKEEKAKAEAEAKAKAKADAEAKAKADAEAKAKAAAGAGGGAGKS